MNKSLNLLNVEALNANYVTKGYELLRRINRDIRECIKREYIVMYWLKKS